MAEPWRHEYGEIEDVRLHWVEAGAPGVHPPVVLVHGLGDAHVTWRPVVERLATDRLVLVPDLAGCGLSGRPDASYALAWHTRIVAEWLTQRDLGPVDLVGHSYGGGVAQMMLLERPALIRRLVLASSGGLGRELNFWLKFAAFPYFVENHGQPFMGFGTRQARRKAKGQARDDVEALAAMNATPGTARAFSRTVRDVISFRGQERQTLDRAHEIAAFPPMAVLWGEDDVHIPVAHGRGLAERLDGVRFRSFPGCGHYVHHEAPDEFVEEVRAFLDDPAPAGVALRPTLA